MKIYLAGKVAGEPNYREIFAEAAEKLRIEGHQVYNPAAANQEGRTTSEIMAHHLPQLCASEALALLSNWTTSGGSQIEYGLAQYLGKEIIYL